jgi:uncharacterized protein
MTASTEPPPRIVSLDVIRGIAVMGIFSVNVVGMAMIKPAYFYPPAYGFEGLADQVMWFANFVLVDGKFRSLFSMLFGASTLVVIERAIAAARSPAKVHFARMLVLMLFGWLHFALFWWGDILTLYAAVGMLLYLFWKLSTRSLLVLSIAGFVLFAGPSAYSAIEGYQAYAAANAPDASAAAIRNWQRMTSRLHPNPNELVKDKLAHRSPMTHFQAMVPERAAEPFDLGPLWIETLSLMLLGMAGYKSGFLTGEWDDRSYKRVALVGLGAGGLAYALLGLIVWRGGFTPPDSRMAYGGFSPPLRPIMACGYAALFMLMFRHRSALRERLAAVGRTAFTNYLGSTAIGTLVFFDTGLGLYGAVSRAEAWLLVPIVWGIMLLWSKPWLDRFNYGPFEWLWRSLARLEVQPMMKRRDGALAAS